VEFVFRIEQYGNLDENKEMKLSEIIKRAGLKKVLPEEKPVLPTGRKVAVEEIVKTEKEEILVSETEKLPAEQVYGEAITCIKKILDSFEKSEVVIDFMQVHHVVNNLLRKVLTGNEQIIILTNKSTPDNYLYGHSVNVSILTIKLGHALNWTEDKLLPLGIAALLHDSGMTRVLPLASRPAKLNPTELEEIKRHPLYGKEILEKLDNEIEHDIKELITTVAYQEHERVNGRGYPRGLKNRELHEFAKVIGLVDAYEGLTHPRPYRERMLPHDGLRYLIETSEEEFEATVFKVFIEQLSLYPLGSFVRLNTEEVCEVVKSNHKFPTRPAVKVIIGPRGERMAGEKIINLTEAPILYIREPVDETKLKISDKQLALKLKVNRWWISGRG